METHRIADQLKRSVEGPAWHGPSVMEIVRDITASEAFARPIPAAHSTWEILLHVSAWEREALRTLDGRPYTVLAGEADWPPVSEASGAAWNDVLRAFLQDHERLVSAIRALPDDKLEEAIPGTEFTFYFLLHGVVQHNLYHAGQIAMLKKAL